MSWMRKIISDWDLVGQGVIEDRARLSNQFVKSLPVILSCSHKKIQTSISTSPQQKAKSCRTSLANMASQTVPILDTLILYHLILTRLMNSWNSGRTCKIWRVSRWSISSTFNRWWNSSMSALTSRGLWRSISKSWYCKKTIQSITYSNLLLVQGRNSYHFVTCRLNC